MRDTSFFFPAMIVFLALSTDFSRIDGGLVSSFVRVRSCAHAIRKIYHLFRLSLFLLSTAFMVASGNRHIFVIYCLILKLVVDNGEISLIDRYMEILVEYQLLFIFDGKKRPVLFSPTKIVGLPCLV